VRDDAAGLIDLCEHHQAIRACTLDLAHVVAGRPYPGLGLGDNKTPARISRHSVLAHSSRKRIIRSRLQCASGNVKRI
jgi:hypothetical protein